MHTLRKKLVPALITSLCAILLPLSGCKIVPNDQRAKTTGSSANQTAEGFNAAGYVDSVWASQLTPHFDSKANDLATVIAAVKADLDKAGHDYGHRAASEGSPWSFAVKSTGKVVSVNTESRAGTLIVEIASDAGPQQITLQIGPVVKGTAIRDSLPFFSFANVTNQIEFAQVGRAFNERALKEVEKPLAELKTPGTAVEFKGAISLTSVPETFVVTPVSLKAAGSAQ
ncbi:MAG: DUF2291 domain-containing protein [Propionivibrio sp.]|jgi:predicted lipoprotein|uniref:DUF2291 family protein n=1 Tax=Propionivibrio sp. TaxID=2212460 RepID=UPI001B7ACD7C|nr:DUF2291 domain-containing protein [Propionivibrio sp.]MBP7201763.1 DUF2291 domain-containing protein [Propionivibrio sp.]